VKIDEILCAKRDENVVFAAIMSKAAEIRIFLFWCWKKSGFRL